MPNRSADGPKGAFERPADTDCDEDTFLYLLEVERARAERSNRPLRLLFATMESSPGQPVPIPRASAARLFKALKSGLRETDVTGWYRQGRVAGAVLSASGEAPDAHVSDAIGERVGQDLRQHLPSRVARSLRVRVVQIQPPRSAIR